MISRPPKFEGPTLATRLRRSFLLPLLAAVATFGLVACGGGSGGGGGTSVIVTPSTATIAIGDTVALNAAVAGGGNAVNWSSNTPTVASVAASGLVTGISAGQAVVTATLATDPSKHDSATVTVTASDAHVPGALTALDGGMSHTVALAADGSVWSWGANLLGQLGVGTLPAQSLAPLKASITDVVDVAAGDNFTVALKADGTVWAWGSNSSKQLGANTVDPWLTTPVQVAGIAEAVAIDAAAATGMALLADGTVMMWGANFGGVLGRGAFTPVDDATPVVVSGLTHVAAISLGGTTSTTHALALATNGEVWAWGNNASAALGQPTSIPAIASATKVSTVSNVSAVATGANFSLVLYEDGTVGAWGAANVGQLGAGSVGAFSQTPVTTAVSEVKALVAGQQHAMALHSDGTVSSWGSNGFGRLGIGADSGFRLDPVTIDDVDFVLLAAGVQFSLALDAEGKPWGWGANLSGQLGVATSVDTTGPLSIW